MGKRIGLRWVIISVVLALLCSPLYAGGSKETGSATKTAQPVKWTANSVWPPR
jgi:hypothetical protein